VDDITVTHSHTRDIKDTYSKITIELLTFTVIYV